MKGINIVENGQVENTFYSTYEKGQHAGETYYTQISNACVNPLCTCGEVAFGLRPVDSSEIPPSGIPSDQREPGTSYHPGPQPYENSSADNSGFTDSNLSQQPFPIEFHLDVLREKAPLPASGEKDSLGYRLAKDFARELTDSMWEQLRTYFYAEKSSITRAIKDLDSLEADFSPMQDDIQNESVLVAYYLILPYAESMPFMHEGKKHLAIDQYCVVPRCSCTQVSISFYCEADNSDKMISIGTHYIYDYKKKKWETDDADDDTATARQPMLTSLIRAFEREHPQFRDELKKRHRTLRRLYSNYLERTNQSAEAPVSDEMPKKSFGRVGRNDPCPCGSGRKYKQCCGR